MSYSRACCSVVICISIFLGFIPGSVIDAKASYSKKSWRLSARRGKAMVKLIKDNASFSFRRFYGVKILNDFEESNAWNLGTHIYITSKAMSQLDDGALLAVIAHEMAHREFNHIYSRAGMVVGGSIAAFFDRDNEGSFSDRYNGFLEDYQLRQEMQADCAAYNWLSELKKKGFAADPMDLNAARIVIFDIDFSNVDPEFYYDLSPYIRHKKVESGYGRVCEL